MSESTHTYRAFLIAEPDDVEMPVRGGRITLDAGRAPHVTATLDVSAPGVWELTPVGYPEDAGFGYGEGEYGGGGYGGWYTELEWVPDEIALEALDPRLNARVRIEVDAVTAFGTISREFDLGLRERPIQHREAVITLELASDEALLTEWGPLEDDPTPLTFQTSLRDIVDYVLDAAIPGAELEASPSVDADMTAFWELTNLIPNPSGETDTVGWVTSTGASALASVTPPVTPPLGTDAVRWTAAAGTSRVVAGGWDGVSGTKVARVSPGRPYIASIHLLSSVARDATLTLAFRDENGVTLPTTYITPAVSTSTSVWTQYSVAGTAPADAAYVYLIVNTLSNAGSEFHYGDAVSLVEDIYVPAPFDGDSTDSDYTYSWSDVAHASTSTRVPNIDRPPESLIWRAGQSAIDFLQPLVQSAGLRLVCDENREWTLRDEDFTVDGSLSIRHAVNMANADETISRDSGIWFDAAVARYTWTDTLGLEHVMTDSYALDTPYTRLRLFEFDRPYPGPGFAEYAVRRAQQRGREIEASAVSDWTAHAEQSVTIYLDDTPTQTGKSESVTFDLSTDEMTVTARTQDTPEGSIDLLTGIINDLVGTIDGL